MEETMGRAVARDRRSITQVVLAAFLTANVSSSRLLQVAVGNSLVVATSPSLIVQVASFVSHRCSTFPGSSF